MSNRLLHSSVAEKGYLAAPNEARRRAGRVRSPAIGARCRDLARRPGVVALSAASVALAMWSPTPAAAAPPVVVDQGEFDFTVGLSADEFIFCDVDVVSHVTGSFRVTQYFDGDGNLTQVRSHLAGTTRITSDYGEAVDRAWVVNSTVDPEALTETQIGNLFNVHSGEGGILVNDSGRVILDLTTGETISMNGPHDAYAGDVGELCAILEGH